LPSGLIPSFFALGKRYASDIASKIKIEGATFLSGGLFEGIKQFKKSREEMDNTRTGALLLFTDGEPTNGITEEGALAAETRKQLAQLGLLDSTAIFTFGYGSYHKASLLRALADPFRVRDSFTSH